MKRLVRTFVSVAALATATAVCADGLDDARQALERGRYKQALSALDDHLQSQPQDAEARFLRGLSLVMLERDEDAIRAFADLARDFPELPEPYNNLAVLYARAGQYEKARDALEAALAAHPSYATAHENLGDIYTALASAAYNRALVLDKSNSAIKTKLDLLNQLTNLESGGAPATIIAPQPRPQVEAPKPVAPKADPAVVDSVLAAVEGWRSAWVAQDVEAYLGAYSPNFVPGRGISRDAWEAQRRRRLANPSTITIDVLSPTVTSSGNTAEATFVQIYASNTYSDQVRKTLEFERLNGRWLITRESVKQ